MSEWKNCTISDLGNIIGGATPSTKNPAYYDGGEIPWITPKDLAGFQGRFISHGERNITEAGLRSCSAQMLPAHTILFSSRAPIGYIAIAANSVCTNQGFKSVIPNDNTDYLFLYYLMKYYKHVIEGMGSGTTFKEVSAATMREIKVRVPKEKRDQHRIAAFLSTLDDKIENNNQINKNLLKQVSAVYHEIFPTIGSRTICRADEYFDISIGKTPPRKEPHWFTNNPDDVTWVSISDMGSCDLYVSKSSEQLTPEAVKTFNINIVPDNTVLLSFKLTVGRIAISDGLLTTNEAIAHFKTDKPEINEYLYCYLKDFDFRTLGSTSSIAIAVNSKIIKGMPFVVPANKELKYFHSFANPLFMEIKSNIRENQRLSALRDALLPKLMSGDLDVSNIDL